MKKIIILTLVDLVIFITLRIISILIAFTFFGIGASASSEKYSSYILIPALLFQLLLIYFFYKKKKFVDNKKEVIILFLFTLFLFFIGRLGVIPF